MRFHLASVSALPFADGALDFAYALGVLHHVPDTAQAIRDVAAKLKPGAPFLLYLYYALDNRSAAYRMLWQVSNAGRLILSRAPYPLQITATTLIAYLVYWPLARAGRAAGADRSAAALLAARLLPPPRALRAAHRRLRPLLHAAGAAFHARTDRRHAARGRLRHIKFSDKEPFWVAVATKR